MWTKSSPNPTNYEARNSIPGTNYLLLETGGYLLLETGGKVFLENSNDLSALWTKLSLNNTVWTRI